MEVKDLKQDAHNYRKHSKENKRKIKKSIDECGYGRSVVIDADGVLIAGNGVHSVTDENTKVRVIETDGTELVVVKRTDLHEGDEKRKKLAAADNATADNVEWDFDNLLDDFDMPELEDMGIEVSTFDEEDNDKTEQKNARLIDKFIVPPFSILDTRQGYWQDRKAYWRKLIGDNGESREYLISKTDDKNNFYNRINNGVSLLDPVLAEVLCRWFGIGNGKAFDCFAGDTIFGYVSAALGMQFTGIELREEQASLNNERVEGMNAKYICDDGQNVAQHIDIDSQDLLFSCPPYYDLEVYSDKPNDASNQETYEDFLQILRNAFTSAIKCLKKNRFACIVVGDIRDKNGFYRDFVGDIKKIFKDAGMNLYNECILINNVGTAMMAASCYMKNRKVVKLHQNVLIFYKGNPKEIKNNFPIIEYKDNNVYGSKDME